ncbi:MAG: hypothetical protein AAFR71_02600 [Pseudomonadota bacterium]
MNTEDYIPTSIAALSFFDTFAKDAAGRWMGYRKNIPKVHLRNLADLHIKRMSKANENSRKDRFVINLDFSESIKNVYFTPKLTVSELYVLRLMDNVERIEKI